MHKQSDNKVISILFESLTVRLILTYNESKI